MIKNIWFAVFIFSFANVFAQKKLIPVSHSEITGITLRVGSKKDGRILSNAAAGTLLEMEGNKFNAKVSATEVLILPPFSSGGFSKDSLFKKLTDIGWQITAVKGDKEYTWLQKGNRNVICYFSMDTREIDLYFGETTTNPNQPNPGKNGNSGQPVVNGSVDTLKTNPVHVGTNVNNPANSAVVGIWSATASDQSSYRVNNGVMNYIVRQYSFNADGTYSYVSKAYDPLMDKILLGKENGSYRLNGTNLAVIPEKSVLEAWSKKDGRDEWGQLLSSQNITPENITYQYTKHYFSGIKELSLVLQANKQTFRDGPFSGGTAFNNAWIYGPPCSQCLIKLPN